MISDEIDFESKGNLEFWIMKKHLDFRRCFPSFCQAWLGVHAKVQPPPFSSHLEEVRCQESPKSMKICTCKAAQVTARESCCWICENWIEQEVCYIPGTCLCTLRLMKADWVVLICQLLALLAVPGWSGPASSSEEVVNVFAYFSVDGFSRRAKMSQHRSGITELNFGN